MGGNKWQDEGSEAGRKRVEGKHIYNTAEWKKLLRTARNRSILQMPME